MAVCELLAFWPPKNTALCPLPVKLVGQGDALLLPGAELGHFGTHCGEGLAIEMRHGLRVERPLDHRAVRIALQEVAGEAERLGFLAEHAGMDQKDIAHGCLRVVTHGNLALGQPANKPE